MPCVRTSCDPTTMIDRSAPVFRLLEDVQRKLWSETPFDAGRTILTLTQRAAALWPATVLTRAWHHPEFDPNDSNESHKALRDQLHLGRVVYDDPEPDEFIHVMPRSTYDFFHEQQDRYRDWRNKPRRERPEIFRRLKDRRLLDKGYDSFDEFDSMMSVDLDVLKLVRVDYTKIKFGHDCEERGIYGVRHGDGYYIGPRDWVLNTTSRNTFLTTENVGANIIDGCCGSYRLNLIQVPGIYPLKIPTYLDRRASAGRKDQKRVSALATEILAADSNATIISDGVEGVDGVKTFQSMKGLNGLEERNIYVIATCIAPERFAELNVIGQWLGNSEIIADFFR
jgi:hypothetical protein